MFNQSILATILLSLLFLNHEAYATSKQLNNCQVVFSQTNAEIQKCDKLKVIYLKGTPNQRAESVGKLIKHKAISSNAIQFYAELINKRVDNYFVRAFLKTYYSFWISNRIDHNKSDPLFQELKIMSDAGGLDFSTFKKALLLPDLGTWGIGRLNKNMDPLGCTTAARTERNGDFYLGRNLDYTGAGVWDADPVLYVHLPEDGSTELKHVAFSSGALSFASITGVNEAGIYIGVHQNYTYDGELEDALPLYLVGERVLRKAKSLEEAIELLKQHRPYNLWTYVVADVKKNQVVSVEVSGKQFAVIHGKDGNFAQTNHLRGVDSSIQRASYGSFHSSQIRLAKTFDLLSKIPSGQSSFEAMAKILSYQESDLGPSTERDIIKPGTVQSVLISRDQSQNKINLAMAVDEAPTSSGRYISFDMQKLFEHKPQQYSVVNSQASLQNRTMQMALSRASAFDLDGRWADAWYAIKDQRTAGAHLTRSYYQYKREQYEDAYRETVTIEESPESFPQHTKESLAYMSILSLHKMMKYAQAKSIARKLIAQPMKNQVIAKILKDYLEEWENLDRRGKSDRSSPQLKAPSFDYMPGDLAFR